MACSFHLPPAVISETTPFISSSLLSTIWLLSSTSSFAGLPNVDLTTDLVSLFWTEGPVGNDSKHLLPCSLHQTHGLSGIYIPVFFLSVWSVWGFWSCPILYSPWFLAEACDQPPLLSFCSLVRSIWPFSMPRLLPGIHLLLESTSTQLAWYNGTSTRPGPSLPGSTLV